MSIDKFGTHIFGKLHNKSLEYFNQNLNTLNVVNINNVKLYYNIVLPFIGSWNEKKQKYDLLQDGRDKYIFPFKEGTIEKLDVPTSITLKVNNNSYENGASLLLKNGDEITFYKSSRSVSPINPFYGEIIIKCPILIEQ